MKVVFDPSKITYGQLLRIFFSVAHDPTQLNRQGPDVGSSYRSVIFYSSDEQQKISKAYIAQLDAAQVFPKPIVTQVVPLKAFYDADAYHQDYALHNPNNPYIMVCDRPKIEALKQEFPEFFKDYRVSDCSSASALTKLKPGWFSSRSWPHPTQTPKVRLQFLDRRRCTVQELGSFVVPIKANKFHRIR